MQSFRARCWEFPVIGLPPFVTPGFNADFDGDTMAVFIPPYNDAEELGHFSEVIKTLIRQILRKNGLSEEDFSKPVDWKVKISEA